MGQAIEHPGPLRQPLDQPGIGQKLQMPRDPGLALVQHLGDLPHRQLPIAQQRDQPEPRGLPGGAQRIQEGVEG